MEFLDHFPGRHVFCTVNDRETGHKPHHFHEGYDLSREEIFDKLKEENKDYWGVFFTVNEIDRSRDPGSQRTSAMVTKIRAVFADDDTPVDKPREDWPIEPNIIVETSKVTIREGATEVERHKYHYYWLTDADPSKLEEWRAVQYGIVKTFGTDSQSRDAVRILRVPGFNHCKLRPRKVRFKCVREEHYSWNDIISAFPPDYTVPEPSSKSNGSDKESSGVTFSSFGEAKESIVSGTHYHGAIMWLLNHWVNKGHKDSEELLDLIQMILDKAEVKDERWRQRCSESYLKNNIKDALGFVAANPVEEVVTDFDVTEIDDFQVIKPPGAIGRLIDEINEMAFHKNEAVALVAAYGLIAGIAGRNYNVLGTGLNLYLTLLADSGIGKSNIKNSINRALRIDTALEGGPLFIGRTRFTGPKAIFDMLQEGMCKVSILEEAGLMGLSTSGDQKGMLRIILDLYTSSGYREFAGGEGYSNSDHSIPVLNYPSLSIISVSTPESYLQAMRERNSLMSGELARLLIIRASSFKEYLNNTRRLKFSEEIAEKLKTLVGNCRESQYAEDLIPTNIDPGMIDVEKESNYWVDLENDYKGREDYARATIASRAFIKTMKIAALGSVFEGSETIIEEQYNYAKDLVEIEAHYITQALMDQSVDDIAVIIKTYVGPIIWKIINGKYNDLAKTPPRKLQGKGIFTKSNLMQAIRNNKYVKEIDDNPKLPNPKKGGEKIIAYMLRNDLISQVPEAELSKFGARRSTCYRIRSEFKEFMEIGD